MGYQFFHAYTFSTGGKHQAAGAIGEACRDPDFSAHVKNPKPPEWVEGNRELVEGAIRNYQENWKDSRGHKLRVDGQVLRADVVAWPADMSPEDRKRGQALTLDYYREKYGAAFRGALIHADEPFKDEGLRDKPREHLHLFIVPEVNQRFDEIHSGLKAKKNADRVNRAASKEEKAAAKAHGSEAYREAMKGEQDEFFKKVGQQLGLQRKDYNSPRERISKKKQSILNNAKDNANEIRDEAKEAAQGIKKDADRAAANILAGAEKELSGFNKRASDLKAREKAQEEREKEFVRGRDTKLKEAEFPKWYDNEVKNLPLIGKVFLESYINRIATWAAGRAQRVVNLIKDHKEKEKALQEDKEKWNIRIQEEGRQAGKINLEKAKTWEDRFRRLAGGEMTKEEVQKIIQGNKLSQGR